MNAEKLAVTSVVCFLIGSLGGTLLVILRPDIGRRLWSLLRLDKRRDRSDQ